jgi:Cu/Ag efflux protein CusF
MKRKSKLARILTLILTFSLITFSGVIMAQHHGGHNHGGAPAAASAYAAQGVIKAIGGNKLTIAHGAVPELRWGPMVMDFLVEDPSLLEDVQAGDEVRFIFTPRGRSNIILEIEII